MTNTSLYPEGCTAPDMGCLLEDYLSGALSDEQVAAFEEHYFKCGACLEAIRVRQSGPHALARSKLVSRRRTGSQLLLLAGALVVVALLYVAFRAGGLLRPGHASAESLGELSRMTAPVYVPSATAGSDDEPRRRFVEAMQAYVAGDFSRAVSGLEASWRGDSSRPETGFYLGAACLLTKRVDRAIEALSATIALGDSPFQEPAHILLAKAYLRRESVGDARRELRAVVDRGGALRGEAERLLEGIGRVAPETK